VCGAWLRIIAHSTVAARATHCLQTCQPSGIFNTYAIPFNSVRVTVTLLSAPDNGTATTHSAPSHSQDTTTCSFWIILRGHSLLSEGGTGSPTFVEFNLPGSGVSLPATARFKTWENTGVALKPGDYLEIVRSTSASGMVYMVALEVNSPSNPTFLEGCFRVTDPVTDTTRFLLSSGTEDFFLGTCE
jgi:hypothetical protein